jgi:hypothetical protein
MRTSVQTIDYLRNIVTSGHTGIVPFVSGKRRSVSVGEARFMVNLYDMVQPRTKHVLAMSMRMNVCLFDKILAFAQRKLT